MSHPKFSRKQSTPGMTARTPFFQKTSENILIIDMPRCMMSVRNISFFDMLVSMFQGSEVIVMKQIIHKENRMPGMIGSLTTILTVLMILAGIPGLIVQGVRLLGAADPSAVEILHFFYLLSMVAGIAVILIRILLLPSDPKEFRARACRSTFRTSGHIFLFLSLWELVYASADGMKTGLFQIFNLEITLQFIVFIFGAFLMYSISRFLEVYAAYEEDSRLTI